MRTFINFGLSGLLLGACTIHIGESATDGESTIDSGSATAASTGSSSAASSGEMPTTGSPATSEASTDAGSTGAGGTTEASASSTGATSATSGGTDEPGSTGGSSGETAGSPTGDATVDDSCAPNDGPALEFRLELSAPMCGATWSGDVLRVMLYQGGPLAPGVYMLAGNGFASLEQGGQPPVTSESGTITIDAWAGDMVSGSYMLPGLTPEVIAGSFAGPHCPGGGLCG